MSIKKDEIIERLREIFSNINIKTYLYGIAAIAMIILIILNTHNSGKYSTPTADGKITLNIAKVAKDYGLDISDNNTDNSEVDYSNNNSNLTKDLTNSLYMTSLYLDQNGLTDPTVKGQILANIVLEYQKLAKGKVYTEEDLNIIRGTDKTSLEDYANNLKEVLGNYQATIQDLSSVNTSSTDTTPTEEDIVNLKGEITANILQNIDINNTLINSLISIPATIEGATYQLQLINLISQENTFLKSLAYIDTDPMKYVLNNNENFEQEFENNFNAILKSFKDYFTKSGIKV